MIIFAIIWLAGGVAITAVELLSAINHPEDEKGNWWLLQVLGVAVGWPLIFILMILVGIYNTIEMELK